MGKGWKTENQIRTIKDYNGKMAIEKTCPVTRAQAGKKKGRSEKLRTCQGSRVPGSNCYRCFLSDLTGLAAHPPPGFA